MKSKTFFKQLVLIFILFLSTTLTFGQICGDIDGNGLSNIVDALLVAQCYVGLIDCPDEEIGDVDCSGAINIVDALLISQFYVGLIQELNCCDVTPTPEEPTPTPETPTPTPGGDCGTPPPTDFMNIEYLCIKTAAFSNEIRFDLKVNSFYFEEFDISDIKIRYYYTKEDTDPEVAGFYDIAIFDSSGLRKSVTFKPSGTFYPELGYVEIGLAADDVTLRAREFIYLQVCFHKQPYAAMDQSNDPSFEPTFTSTDTTPTSPGFTVHGGIGIVYQGLDVWGPCIIPPTPTPTPTPPPTPTPQGPTEEPTDPPTPVPGIYLEAEDYDRASDNDASNNGFRGTRTDGVDLEDCWEGGLNTGWASGGEWLEWDVSIPSSGTYNVWVRAGHDDVGTLTGFVEIDGSLVGNVSVPNTDPYGVAHPPGHWQKWESYDVGSVSLNTGTHTVRLELTGAAASFNVDYVYLVDSSISPPEKTPVPAPNGYVKPVDKYGQLYVIGTDLCDNWANPVQLRGVSSHDLRWHWIAKNHTIQNIAYNLGIELFRLVIYVDPENYGYVASGHRQVLRERLFEYMEDAIETGIYVIVDWHVLKDKDPNKYKDEAIAFFDEMSNEYGQHANVIWEICNEPNGVQWPTVKQYAEDVIPVIRSNDPENIIVVGSSTWSSDVHIASEDPIKGQENIMYSFHFYAGSHGDDYKNKAETAILNGSAIFVTEWGTTDASGGGSSSFSASQDWVDWMADNNISWCNWAFCNKNEGASILTVPSDFTGPWSSSNLTATGKWIVNRCQ